MDLKITYGKTAIHYELLRMNRKTLEIAVHPPATGLRRDQTNHAEGVRVVVKAPLSCGMEAIEAKMRKRVRWIQKQMAYFQQFEPRTPARRYVGGESHLYLGRNYRLKLAKSEQDNVSLKNGYFIIKCVENDPAHIKDLLAAWYQQQASRVLAKVFEDCWERFRKQHFDKLNDRCNKPTAEQTPAEPVEAKPTLKVQKMKKRWGSLSAKGQLTLNLRLIQTRKTCIEYAVLHELCHLIYPNHSADFYKLLERTLPDWNERKHQLEMSLV